MPIHSMENMLKLQKIKTANNVKGLRYFFHQVDMCVRNLKSPNVEMNPYGSLLIPLMSENEFQKN